MTNLQVNPKLAYRCISQLTNHIHTRCMDSKSTRRANLRRLKDAVGTWAEVAEPAKTDPKYLTQIASETTRADMGDDVARRLEQAHNKPFGWMDQNNDTERSQGRGVPIVGTVRAGAERHYLELEYPVGHGDGSVGYNSKDPSAYALRVEGDSMVPRIRPGEFVVVSPEAIVRPGDDVMVSTRAGLKMVKLYLYERDGMLTLDSINSAYERMSIPMADVESVHKVVCIAESGSRESD